jgi:rod shape-determining protein MreC
MSFMKKYKNRMIVAFVAIILIVIIGITAGDKVGITRGENLIGNIFSPVQKLFFSLGEGVTNFFESITNIGSLKKENEELKLKVAKLEEQNRMYENLIGQSEYLIREKELLENTRYNLISAQVVGKEPGNWFNRFVIDKGEKDGVKKGDIVIQAVNSGDDVIIEGVVGRVIETGDNWAKVISIIDENSNISFKVIRTQDGGILSGGAEGQLSGYMFDSEADVIKGDKLFTSGIGGVYKANLYIGEVSNVIKEDENLTKRIEVIPAVDFKKIYRVFIISD